ncbi:hypothetical protein BDN72DRAFT_906983 [Pluteus cervinus]|uniref:Uncharacterized protein n=1 Tax=Pluteus cervinus TaxID=181527 RepID=A0ACD2ZXR6_9AGAR|nr:hypothetical protein BDN72DRAFT_906983 [Pluteus cervinus]
MQVAVSRLSDPPGSQSTSDVPSKCSEVEVAPPSLTQTRNKSKSLLTRTTISGLDKEDSSIIFPPRLTHQRDHNYTFPSTATEESTSAHKPTNKPLSPENDAQQEALESTSGSCQRINNSR